MGETGRGRPEAATAAADAEPPNHPTRATAASAVGDPRAGQQPSRPQAKSRRRRRRNKSLTRRGSTEQIWAQSADSDTPRANPGTDGRNPPPSLWKRRSRRSETRGRGRRWGPTAAFYAACHLRPLRQRRGGGGGGGGGGGVAMKVWRRGVVRLLPVPLRRGPTRGTGRSAPASSVTLKVTSICSKRLNKSETASASHVLGDLPNW
jgi:hypothetical protein